MLGLQLNDSLKMGPPTKGAGQGESEDKHGSPSKVRIDALSDKEPPVLSPSPKFREPTKKKSQDDTAIDSSPTTPRRPAFPARGLSLQMPPRDLMSPTANKYLTRAPLSPKLDAADTFGSPAGILPRRSRGLDFSRAATNLHHSTLAESPDSSPTIGGRAMNIPGRSNGNHFSGRAESPGFTPTSLWSTMANTDRTNISGSLGSINMMGSDSSESSSDDDLMDADDIDDSILSTPQIPRISDQIPFADGAHASPGNMWMSGQSPAVSSLMSFQRARLRNGKSKKGSSSGSGSSMASPRSKSPPGTRTLENISINKGLLGRDIGQNGIASRRESISWAANQLHISGSESDDGTLKGNLENMDGMPTTPGREQRGVIRRVVTRRGNMLVSI